MVKAAVVILNWNGEAMLRKYIPALYASLRLKKTAPDTVSGIASDSAIDTAHYDASKTDVAAISDTAMKDTDSVLNTALSTASSVGTDTVSDTVSGTSTGTAPCNTSSIATTTVTATATATATTGTGTAPCNTSGIATTTATAATATTDTDTASVAVQDTVSDVPAGLSLEETVPQIVSEPAPAMASEVSSEPASETRPEISSEPVQQTIPEISSEPAPAMAAEITSEPASETRPEISSEPAQQTIPEIVSEHVAEIFSQPDDFEANLFSDIDPSFMCLSSQNEKSTKAGNSKSGKKHSKDNGLKSGHSKTKVALERAVSSECHVVPSEKVILNVSIADLIHRKDVKVVNERVKKVMPRQRKKALKESHDEKVQQEVPMPQYELIVADNASTDGSLAWLRENYPDIRLIELDKNYGFAGGYNRALKEVEAEYYVLLNSDVRVTPDWLDILIDFLDTHKYVSVCMPKILKESDDPNAVQDIFEYAGACGGFIDRFGYPFCRGRVLKCIESDYNQYDTPMEVFWASGAAMCVRSNVWRELNGFDARFFAHMEEIDFCWRAQLLYHQVWVVPAAKVYHVGGGTLPNESPYKLYLNYRNNLLMLQKNLPRYNKNNLIFFRMILDGASALIFLISGRKELYKSVLKAHKDFKAMRYAIADSPRTLVHSNIPFKRLYGVLNGSIILSYFLGNRRFSDLSQFI